MASSDERDLQLDGLRGLAILLVVIFHGTYLEGAPSLVGRVALLLPALGWSGVDLFFVLSGFLITRILLTHRDSPNYYKAFYARRVLRIFPMYYLLLAVCFVVIPQFDTGRWNDFWGTRGDPTWYWLYLSNWVNAYDGFFRHFFLTVTWSLCVEEQFYLLWPFVVARLAPRTLERLSLALVGAAFAARLGALLLDVNPIAVYVLTPMRFDALAVGAYVAVRSQREGGFGPLAVLARRVGPPAALAALGVALAAQVDPTWLMDTPNKLLLQPAVQTFGYSGLALAYGSLLVWTLHAPPGARIRRVFENAQLRVMGKYSYAIYLLHIPLIFWFTFQVQSPADPDWPFPVLQAIRWAASVVIPLGMAALTWALIEEPILRLRRRFPYGSSAAAPEVGGGRHGAA